MKKFKELRESYLEEKLKASDPAGTYIHDFVHSDNPKFAGKSKAKRIQMALAASYGAKGKSRNEEVELDEVSKSTLGKYVNKARSDRMDALHSNYRNTDDDYEAAKKDNERVEKRDRGINLARAKINKFGKSGNTIAKVKATEEVGLDKGMMDTVKTVAKKVGKALTGGSDQDQLKNLQKKIGMPQTGKKPTSK